MKPGMILWKTLDLNQSFAGEVLACPASPMHNLRKFSAVFGVVSAKSSKVNLPFGAPSILISK